MGGAEMAAFSCPSRFLKIACEILSASFFAAYAIARTAIQLQLIRRLH
jgi:hypothetical protein